MPTNTGISTPEAGKTPSTRPAAPPRIGMQVRVRLDVNVWRPLIISALPLVPIGSAMDKDPQLEQRVNGTIFCEPEDHTTLALRTLGEGTRDPARIFGRPERTLPLAYVENLARGEGIGQWSI